MSAFRPEAETEYSKGEGSISGPRRGSEAPSKGLRAALLVGGLGGSALLLGAEFTPLLKIHTTATRAAVATVQTGSHHAYALVPIALLTALLTLIVLRTRNRLSLLATGALAVVALLIALLRDLPSAQATGVTSSYVLAKATPSAGFYLETLGAIVLLITAAAGLLFLAPPAPTRRRRQARAQTSPDGPAHGPLPD